MMLYILVYDIVDQTGRYKKIQYCSLTIIIVQKSVFCILLRVWIITLSITAVSCPS